MKLSVPFKVHFHQYNFSFAPDAFILGSYESETERYLESDGVKAGRLDFTQ